MENTRSESRIRFPGSLPIGIISVASIYLGIVIAIRFTLQACLEEFCNDEGMGDTVIMWSSDFLVAFAAFLFGMHLHFGKGNTRKSGTLAQFFMAGSFALMGIMHKMFPSNGTTDNLGTIETWVIGGIANFFLTLSAIGHAYLSIEVVLGGPKASSAWLTLAFVRLWLLSLILSCMTNLAGYVWCAIAPSFQTTEMEDNAADNNLDFQDSHTCIQIVGISEVLLWYSYALLWIPMGLMLKSASEVRSQTLLGLSTTTAAILTITFQWTTGSMYFVTVASIAWVRQEMGVTSETFSELWSRVFGAEIFHLGILLNLFCAHNLSWTLTVSPLAACLPNRDGKDDVRKGKHVRFSDEPVARDTLDQIEEEDDESSEQLHGPSTCSSVGSASAGRYILPVSEQTTATNCTSILKSETSEAKQSLSFVPFTE